MAVELASLNNRRPSDTTTDTGKNTVKSGSTIESQIRAELNISILQTSLSVSISAQNEPLALLYKTAIASLNEVLKTDLGNNAIENAASQDNSPEATAQRIVSTSTGFYASFITRHPGKNEDEMFKNFMQTIKRGFEQGFKEASNILQGLKVLNGEIAANTQKTYDLVQKGYAEFEAAHTVPAAPTPTLTGGFIADGGEVTVEIKTSSSGFDNRIYWSTDNFVTKNYIGIDNQAGNVSLGSIPKGTRIDFGIDNGQGDFFRTGGASVNTDGLDHTVQTVSNAGTQIGFEDLRGGGDRDFNDAIILVRTTPATEPQAANASAKDNRSGLADGSNPGQGAGRVNSPNQGTLNPNAAGNPPVTDSNKPAK